MAKFGIEIKTADLRLSFDNGVQVQVFNNSSGYEGWRASFKDGEKALTAIGLGGGDINFIE